MATEDSSPRPLVTLQQAREHGLLKYFTNKPCSKGHVAERFTSSRGCVECAAIRGASQERKRYVRSYLQKNAAQVREAKREDYFRNIEQRKAAQLSYREKNRQRIRDVGRAFRAANPELAKAISLNARHKRRAAAVGGMTGPELAAWKRAAPKVCYWCGAKCAKAFHIDHYVPLSKGGKHEASNLVVACPPCNAKKRAKDPLEFAASIGRLF